MLLDRLGGRFAGEEHRTVARSARPAGRFQGSRSASWMMARSPPHGTRKEGRGYDTREMIRTITAITTTIATITPATLTLLTGASPFTTPL